MLGVRDTQQFLSVSHSLQGGSQISVCVCVCVRVDLHFDMFLFYSSFILEDTFYLTAMFIVCINFTLANSWYVKAYLAINRFIIQLLTIVTK